MSSESPIDIRQEVINYPVSVGGVVEIAMSYSLEGSIRFRLAEVQMVRDSSVIVALVDVASPVVDMDSALMFRLEYADVLLPFAYLFFHPVAL